jgi:DNA modification methylase
MTTPTVDPEKAASSASSTGYIPFDQEPREHTVLGGESAGPARCADVAGQALSVIVGDALTVLASMPSESVQCCVTSPPYWGLRDYGVPGQIGLEETLEEFIEKLVAVFRAVKRVLKADGTCWINMGDCYAGGGNGGGGSFAKDGIRAARPGSDKNVPARTGSRGIAGEIKAKDLVGQPWLLAFALRADGWYLRRDIIWHKPNAMPESVKDRPTTAHEYLFLLSKSERYYYDADAIKEPVTGTANARGSGVNPKCAGWMDGPGAHRTLDHAKPGGSYKGSVPGRKDRPGQDRRSKRPRQNESFSAVVSELVENRNKRSVWTVPTAPYADAHFATYPAALITPCILAGTKPGDVVLDPFGGSGTTGATALCLGRRVVLIELNPDYAQFIEQRCTTTFGLGL